MAIGQKPGESGRRFRFEGVAVDEPAHKLVIDGRDVACSRRVFQLITLLAEQPGHVYTRDEVTARLWPGSQVVADESLTQIVFRLRATLGRYANCVVTVRGIGLRLDAVVLPFDDAEAHVDGEPAREAPSAAGSGAPSTAAPVAPQVAATVAPPPVAPATITPPSAATAAVMPRRRPWLAPIVVIVVIAALGALAAFAPWRRDVAAPSVLSPNAVAAPLAADAMVDSGFALTAADLHATRADTAQLVKLAMDADAIGDRPRARALLEQALRDPTSPVPWLYLAFWDYAGADHANATARLATAKERLAAIDDPYLRLMGDYVGAEVMRDWSAAMRNAGSMVDLRPHAWFVRVSRAHLLMDRGMLDAGLAELARVEIPKLTHRKLEMALADRASFGDVAGARAAFAKLEPGDPAVHAYVGARIDTSAGEHAKARVGYARAAELAMKSNRLDLRGRAQLYGGILAAEAGDDADARARIRDAQTHLRDRGSAYDAGDAGFLLVELEARSGSREAFARELATLRQFVAEQDGASARASLALLELRLTGETADAAPLELDANDEVMMPGAASLVEARRALARRDRTRATIALREAREGGVYDNDFADEARLLAFELGEEAPAAKPIDPPYPPLARFAARFALQTTQQRSASR